MNSSCDEFLSAARLPINQGCRICRGNSLHLTQDTAQNRAVTYNLFKIQLIADFVLKIEFFLFKLVRKLRDLAIGECVVDRYRHLPRNLQEKINVRLCERIRPQPGCGQHSQDAFTSGKRKKAD